MTWVGIDVGGTFTDGVAYDASSGVLHWAKGPSTPDAPREGVLHVLDKLGVDIAGIERLIHGLTLGTNAILERTGDDVWVVTTRGFRDTLDIARTNRTVLYNIKTLKPEPLVPRHHIFEVDERITYDGSVLRPLSEADLKAAVVALVDNDAAAVAVCFLHSYANAEHEAQAAARIREHLPEAFVSTSSEVLPEFREYERFSTTVLNAYIGNKVGSYLEALAAGLSERGYRREVFIMTSSGGVATATRAAQYPARTVLSGPAGGVAAAVELGRLLDVRNLVTYDMGGTSTDVCLVEDLQIPISNEQSISDFPNRTAQIEINAVGAGGGSIAWVDAGRILKVGPTSAGAEPGPACYGRGGDSPTVTDANLLLGRLSASRPLGGEVALDAGLAERAMQRLGEQFPELGIHALAEGIIKIAVVRMVSAVKEISIGKGHDPRDFTLVAFGGAGPMHAALIAEELEMLRVVIPPAPGNFSALGAMLSDLRHDYIQTRVLNTRETPFHDIDAMFRDMESKAIDDMTAEGVARESITIKRALGMRYVGQSWELIVDMPAEAGSAADLEAAFQRAHEQRYGHGGDDPTQVVNFRLTAFGQVSKPRLPEWTVDGNLDVARLPSRYVYFTETARQVNVYDRDRLPAGDLVGGPAIVEEAGSVTIVPPGWACRVGPFGVLIMERAA